MKYTHYLHLANAIRSRQSGFSTYLNWYILRHFTRTIKEIYNIKEKEFKRILIRMNKYGNKQINKVTTTLELCYDIRNMIMFVGLFQYSVKVRKGSIWAFLDFVSTQWENTVQKSWSKTGRICAVSVGLVASDTGTTPSPQGIAVRVTD